MHRRTALRLGATGAVSLLAGCASLRGALLGSLPRSYEVRNESAGGVPLRVSVFAVRGGASGDAIHATLSSRRFGLSSGETRTVPWPEGDAETYQIEARLDDERWAAFSFSPGDWRRRHTPVVRTSDEGVGVFVE